MELVLHMTRDEHGRLNGTVRSSADPSPHEFSGTLELLRLFEELVPDERPRSAIDSIQQPRAEEREWTDESS